MADVDGTLLGKQGTISTEDKQALARAYKTGIGISLSTGRVRQTSLKIIDQLSLDGYHIFFDGALVNNPETDDTVYGRPISREKIRQMIEFAHRSGVTIDFYSVSHFFAEEENWTTDIRREFFGIEPVIVDFDRLWQEEEIFKGTLVVASAEEKARAEFFCRHFGDSISFSVTSTPSYPGVDFINVLAPGVSKGEALEALVSHLGVPLSAVAAIGDGVNDVSLLAKAGLAIAMDNAPPELKAVADHITRDADHNGVAAAIERFLL
ncbi:MAG: Cof-type HAD-IIB family hydrolase [Dehalococcoidales bacterium]|nr:Cof-type HAD-IIB family hydrolase [Dehalococcoidales bacterium]